MKKIYSIIVLLFVICICGFIALYSYNANKTTNPSLINGHNNSFNQSNLIPDDNIGFGDIITNSPHFSPYIYNQPTVHISMGFTPANFNQVEKCCYTITDSAQRVIANATVQQSTSEINPFSSSAYIINKTLTNLANDNYTFILTVYYPNGTSRIPINKIITVDTTFVEPFMSVLSPQNQKYDSNQIDITYYANSKVLMSYYILDSHDSHNWTPFNGNITLCGLTAGSHELTVFVVTEANRHTLNANEQQTILFSINHS